MQEGTGSLDKLFVSWHRLREQWAGPLALYYWGVENQALRIAAAFFGVVLHEVGEAGTFMGESPLDEAMVAAPFEECIWLAGGTLAVEGVWK